MLDYRVSDREGGGEKPEPADEIVVNRTIRFDNKEDLTWGECYLKDIDMGSNMLQMVKGKTPNMPEEGNFELTVSRFQDGFNIKVCNGLTGDELTGSWTATPPPPQYTPG